MPQLHKRLDPAVVHRIVSGYNAGSISLTVAIAQLGIKRARFFDLLATYRRDPDAFTLTYARYSPPRIADRIERQIRKELETERQLINDPAVPIRTYNYAAIRDTLRDTHRITVSVPTIIARAKAWGFWLPKPSKRPHDREVVTRYAGELIQHDSSHHRWSPSAEAMWYGITSIDDCSRLLLYADLWERETSWTHIVALKEAMIRYGIPLRYYTDNHGIFRFVERRDRMGAVHTVGTDEVDPQWRQVLRDLSVDVTYALSPQAKGKVERPYRWMQDRVVRRCAKEDVRSFVEVRRIFREEAKRYNERQVHSTTGEIPVVRFEALCSTGQSMFRPFTVPQPYVHLNDLFCFREERVVDAYRRIAFHGLTLTIPVILPRQTVELRYAPALQSGITNIRIWYRRVKLVDVQHVKTEQLTGVQF